MKKGSQRGCVVQSISISANPGVVVCGGEWHAEGSPRRTITALMKADREGYVRWASFTLRAGRSGEFKKAKSQRKCAGAFLR